MIPLRKDCELHTSKSRLTETDISIIKKVYCKDDPKMLEKEIKSPNYPKNYPDNLDEEYKVEVDSGFAVALKFTTFKIEDGSFPTNCDYDWVQVVDGDGTILMDKSCTDIPPRIISKTNVLIVKFHSDGRTNEQGFMATWSKVRAVSEVAGGWSPWSGYSNCGNSKDGKHVCRKRRIRYCNSPPPSNGGETCTGSGEETVNCASTDFTEPGDNPNCVLTGGWSVWSQSSECSEECTTTRTRTCNNPEPINDKDCEGEASETSACTGGDCATTATGTITSPNYPNNYSNNEVITFPIEVEMGSHIELTFVDVDIEETPVLDEYVADARCQFDYVHVKDTDGHIIATVCGENSSLPVYKSSGNMMTLYFHSDESVNHKGFKATWKKVKGELEAAATSGEITSPNYPEDYPHDLDIKLASLHVARGFRIKLYFEVLDIESSGSGWNETYGYGYGYGNGYEDEYGNGYGAENATRAGGRQAGGASATTAQPAYSGYNDLGDGCEYDYLKVYDGQQNKTICGSTIPEPITSIANVMSLYFKSDSDISFKGFQAFWQQVEAEE